MSMPTTDGMANSVMSRGMEAVPIRSTLSSPADEARNRSPRGSPAAWASTPSSRSPCAAAPSLSPSSFFSSLMPSRLSSLRRYCSPYGITMTWASPEATGTVSSAVRTRRRPRSSTPVAVPSKVAVPAASSMRTARPVRKDEPS